VRHEETSFGRITRVHPFPTDKRNIPARALAFGGFTLEAALFGARAPWRPDVVLAMSPPLTLGMAASAVARRYGVPWVFNIQDVFPDVAVEVGAITNERVIVVAEWLERTLYANADAVTVLSEDLAENVRAKLRRTRHPDPARVHVIPNFVDTAWLCPGPRDNAYRCEHGLGERTVVMYAGNVGYSQSLDLVIDAARALRERRDVVFVINGGGSARDDLLRDAADLDNVVFVDLQPKERLPEILAAADLHLVPLRRGLARSSVPSKLYSILASGRPVLASVDAGTEVARTVEAAGAGIAVEPEDHEAFQAALVSLLDDPSRLADMGAAGRRYVEGWASPGAVAQRYAELFEALAAAPNG
jgi:colanic acid biosynthesis glycosyl transferase WcaI